MPATETVISEAEAHRAIEARDAAYDGRFVLGVTSTRIYCRPSCPSRRPKPENIRLYASPAAAEAAGFRACLRCEPAGVPTAARLAAQARKLIDEAEGESPSLAALGHAVGVSGGHLQRLFKRETGLSPREYAAARRLDRARASLRAGENVSTAGFAAGYGSLSRFHDSATAHLGMSPDRFRKGGAGIAIAYDLGDSVLGRVLLAATDRGLCFVALGDSDDAVIDALRREFPRASISPAPEGMAGAACTVAEYLNQRGRDLDTVLDVRGSAFQMLVWKALRDIPYGETRTYGQLAAAIGRPAAARAVGRACATNPLPLFIPCHRATGANGDLSGYRYGLDRKRKLLDLEGQASE